MKPVVVEGKSVKEAINLGLTQLGLARDEVKIEILDEGSKGFLGLISVKNARVKISRKKSDLKINDDPEEKIMDIMDRILKTIDIEYTLEIERTENKIKTYIKSHEEGLIIGKRGRTIDAIQHIINRTMNCGPGEANYKVIVDTNGRYREKKEKNLQEMVQKLSNRVVEKQKPITILPLNPYERRIVHIAAKEDNAIDVESIGEGFYKKMVFRKKMRNQ